MALIDRFFERAIRRGELTVIHADGSARTFGAPDPDFAPVTIRFADKGVTRKILADPATGAGEAYMDGRLLIERGDVLALMEMITGNNPWERGRGILGAGLLARATGAVFHRIGRINMAARSKRNVAHHYDLSGALYDLFLDADRQYSCAYYDNPALTPDDLERPLLPGGPGQSLESAQSDKKAHIAAKLYLRPGMKVLDIGCGWGGMALYLHEHTGAEVLGITLSEEQLKVARERAAAAGVADKVRFELIDYRHVTGPFDRIVSVGMFEHVGPVHFRAFFDKCRDLLAPDGVMLLHTIGRVGKPGVTDHFTAKYIFPGGYIPALSETIAANEGNKLMVTDIEILRLHYAYTLREWYARAMANREQIVALYDERFFRMWQWYLCGSMVAFKYGQLVNFQIQFARRRDTLPITRDYMARAEARLRG